MKECNLINGLVFLCAGKIWVMTGNSIMGNISKTHSSKQWDINAYIINGENETKWDLFVISSVLETWKQVKSFLFLLARDMRAHMRTHTPTDGDAFALMRRSISWLKELWNANCWSAGKHPSQINASLMAAFIIQALHSLKLDTSSASRAHSELTHSCKH